MFGSSKREVPAVSSSDFPITLRLAGRDVLMVGAGPVAERRVAQLLELRARVHVVSPAATAQIRAWAAEGRIRFSERPFEDEDCREPLVVFAATNVREVNRAAFEAAHRFGHLANAADDPELCDFYVPSIGRRGPITVAVSTDGLAPLVGAHVRDLAMARVTPGHARLAQLMGRLRKLIPGGPPRTAVFRKLIAADAAELLEKRDRTRVDILIRNALQPSESKS